MDEAYYVPTDTIGLQSDGDHEAHFDLAPDGSGGTFDPKDGAALIYTLPALVNRLDELIFTAEATGATTPAGEGVLRAEGVTLTARTSWDTTMAARFALACVEHVLGDSGEVTLPGGATLAEVLEDAKGFIDGVPEGDGRIARLSRLATARRLRRQGALVGDVARGLLVEDVEKDLAAADDPAWTLAASLVDAVLAAAESLRHVALGRYGAEREEIAGEKDDSASEVTIPRFVNWLPWGQIAIGAEHQSSYKPASHLAREAAMRACETVGQRDGDTAAAAEAEWQAALLAELLEAN